MGAEINGARVFVVVPAPQAHAVEDQTPRSVGMRQRDLQPDAGAGMGTEQIEAGFRVLGRPIRPVHGVGHVGHVDLAAARRTRIALSQGVERDHYTRLADDPGKPCERQRRPWRGMKHEQRRPLRRIRDRSPEVDLTFVDGGEAAKHLLHCETDGSAAHDCATDPSVLED